MQVNTSVPQATGWLRDLLQAAISVLELWCIWAAFVIAVGAVYGLDAELVRQAASRGFALPLMGAVRLGVARLSDRKAVASESPSLRRPPSASAGAARFSGPPEI